MAVANAQAFYNKVTITEVKVFVVQTLVFTKNLKGSVWQGSLSAEVIGLF
jgi:hypothetical protein